MEATRIFHKIGIFIHICGAVDQAFKHLLVREIYRTSARHFSAYGCETWTVGKAYLLKQFPSFLPSAIRIRASDPFQFRITFKNYESFSTIGRASWTEYRPDARRKELSIYEVIFIRTAAYTLPIINKMEEF
jgi:hypothetical protein